MAAQKHISERVAVQSFGQAEDGQEILKYTLKNKSGQEVDVISYGATIVGARTPDKSGKFEDVVLGFDNIYGYGNEKGNYFGSTIGRVANRVRRGKFSLDGVTYTLNLTQGQNSLHGGKRGWSFYNWTTSVKDDVVLMTLLTEDGNEGYPGDVIAFVSYELKDDGGLQMTMKAFTTKATPVNMTNHVYFNLAGHGANSVELFKHEFLLNADSWTVSDSENVTTGEIRRVEGTPMDLRNRTNMQAAMKKVESGEFDHNFCVAGYDKNSDTKLVAQFFHPSGRCLEVFSNQPGFQFYTSNNLPDTNSSGIVGKEGKRYFKYGAFCLETQNFPNAINLENFPNSVLRPGETYNHICIYKFTVKD